MVNYNKLMMKFKEKGITTYTIRQKSLIPQSTLTKFNMCSVSEKDRQKYIGKSDEEIICAKLEEYLNSHGSEFKMDVSTKTIEDICQLLQCQPDELIEWKVDLKPELSYENRFKDEQ